jgi:hypothetical protein
MSTKTGRTRAKAERKRLLATAYHEAGHAVVGFHARHMPRLHRVSIVPDPTANTLGHVLHHPSPRFVEQLRADHWNAVMQARFYEQIQMLYAGPLAEQRFTGRRNSIGASADYHAITTLGIRHIGGWGAVTQALFRYLRLSAAAQLTTRWREVEAVAAALVEHRTLRGHDAVAKVICAGLVVDPTAFAGISTALRVSRSAG